MADTGELEGPHLLQRQVGVVYRVPCGPCCKVKVGQTCSLDHWLKEHRRALTGGNLAQSGIADHAAHKLHVINWEEAKVVDAHPRYHHAELLT